MTSRRPNNRASTENDPGPSKTIEAAIIMRRNIDNQPLDRDGSGAGSQEIWMATAPSPAMTAVSGVRKPMRSERPVNTPRVPAKDISVADGPLLVR